MKGLIFNLLEDFVTEKVGEEGYERILSQCVLKTQEPFVGPGTYPYEDLVAIAVKSAETLGLPLPDALRAFGAWCFPKLAEKFPQFVHGKSHPREFLESVDSVIHVEVRKLHPDAELPHFTYRSPAPDRLVIEYRSRRSLCALMEGLIDGVAAYWRIPIRQEQKRCALRGADVCEFNLVFGANGTAEK